MSISQLTRSTSYPELDLPVFRITMSKQEQVINEVFITKRETLKFSPLKSMKENIQRNVFYKLGLNVLKEYTVEVFKVLPGHLPTT